MSKTAMTMSAIVLILVFGCAKDIIVKPPTSFAGFYHGEYIYQERPGSSDAPAAQEQWIKWTFTDYTFIMDTFRTDLKPAFTCEKWYGTYRIENNVIFDTSYSVGQCNPLHEIRGAFALERKRSDDPERDSLFLTQYGEGNIYKKTIIIIKDSIQ